MLRAVYQGLGVIGLTLIALIPPMQAQEKTKADTNGDALPEGALARLGTLRWRHGDTVSFVAFADAKTVVTATQDNVLRLWDRETGKVLRHFGTQQAAVVPPQPGQPVNLGNVRGSSRIALSPDGKILASLSANNTIHLWDVNSGKELRQFKAPPTGVAAVLFTPDSKMLAVRGTNRTIHLIDAETGNEIRQLQIAPKQVGGVNAVFVIGFQGLGDAAAVAFSPDGKTVAVSESLYDQRKVNYSVKLISVEKGDVLRTIDVANQGVTAVAYARDGKTLAFSNFNAIRLIDPANGKEIRAINTQMGASMLVFSPDGKTIAGKGRDQVTRLFETESAKEIAQLGEAPAGNVNQFAFNPYGMADLRDIAFAPDGKVVAFGTGNVLRFWEVGASKELPMAGGHRGAVNALAVSADGKTIVSRGADNTIRRWDAGTGNELGHFAAPKGTTCAAFSAELKAVAFGHSDTTISVHDVATGKLITKMTGPANGTATLAFSPDGKKLASRGTVEQAIRIFDVANGNELRQIALQENNANPNANVNVILINRGYMMMGAGPALAFSPDGQSVAASVSGNNNGRMVGGFGGVAPAAQGNSLRIFDVSTGKETRKITLPDQQSVVNIAYSRDGRVLAAENNDQTISLWEITSGRLRGQLGTAVPFPGGAPGTARFNPYLMNQAIPGALALSADGELLATKGAENTVRVWDLNVAKEIGQFKGHQGAIASLAFGRTGKTLVSGSNDTTILVWNVASLKREPRPAAVELGAKEVETLWSDLAGDDGIKANKSIGRLIAADKQAVPFLRVQLQPAVPVDPKKIERWIADLDSTNFKTRGTAAAELEKLGELAVPALKKVLTSPSSLETRRRVEPMVERLTGGVLTNEQIRMARAVEVLEKIGTADARQVLEPLAQGAPGAFLTRQAQSALDAIARR